MNERIERVVERFEQVQREVEGLQAATGLACPSGCGACCLSPEVEATVSELRPLALALAADGRGEPLLAELERCARDGELRCVLYVPEPGSGGERGRCSEYALRPLVCRLFGFAARHDRLGQPELVVCRTMRAADADGVARAQAHVRAGGTVAFFGEHARGIAAELPGEGSLRLPINEALARALRATLFEGALRREELAAEAQTAPGDAHALPADPDRRPDGRPGRGG